VVHTDAIMDQGCLPERNMVNIHNPLTALLVWDKLSSDCFINSFNYTINSILLSEQQANVYLWSWVSFFAETFRSFVT